jgi:ribonuclease Y
MISIIITAVVALLAGIGLGYFLRFITSLGKKGSIELEIKELLLSAKGEAQRILDEAKKKAEEKDVELRETERVKNEEFKETEKRLIKKEELLDARQVEIDKEVENIKIKVEDIKKIKEKVESAAAEKQKELEKVAGLSVEEAKSQLVSQIEQEYEEDFLIRMQKLEHDGVERLDRRAKEILATSIQRLASSTAGEIMTTAVNIPNEEVKGKIIGKEGRNIRAFERAAGVELIVDETPNTIVISSFDPVRRQVARLALENLILDGRIQPAKIEEMVQKAQEDINKIIKQKGEEAVFECGIFNFDPRIIAIIGRLYFRTSFFD